MTAIVSSNHEYDYEQFWHEQASNIPWMKQWHAVLDWQEPVAHWFVGGELNASYACLDVHIHKGHGDKIALYWESEQGKTVSWSYKKLYEETNYYASLLRFYGVSKGDIVIVYLPMIPEAVALLLAIVRLGATHSVVFSGFSSQALKDRIVDAQARFVVTADYGVRRGKILRIKDVVDAAVDTVDSVESVFVVRRDESVSIKISQKDIVLGSANSDKPVFVEPVAVQSNHPLFVLYTSGTTGKPKGIVHSTGGYLTYIYATLRWAFDIQPDSVYWCTADIGWITGHSYVVYGPLLHGASIVLYEGAPDFPNPGKWWELIERYAVSIFYTSPTALRMFMRYGDQWPAHYNLESLKILGSVGEVINPEVWEWYHRVIGYKKCTVVDTWWQTETGGFMIAPTPGIQLKMLKAGSATFPLPGIIADVVDALGQTVPLQTKGYLVVKKPWPGMALGILGDMQRFIDVYWSKFPGMYYSGDYAMRDIDGYFWLLGRADEVLNIAGHRIGTAEIESAVVTLEAIAESAAIAVHDDIKGESVVIFAIPKNGYVACASLKEKVVATVKQEIGSFVVPRGVYFVSSLPKTRSGKIMRRLLKAVLEGKVAGDISTLEDETSLDEVKKYYQQVKQAIEAPGI